MKNVKVVQYHCIKCKAIYFGYNKILPKCSHCNSRDVIKIKL